jgi:RNA polymerase sigma factor (sigma-70 family)
MRGFLLSQGCPETDVEDVIQDSIMVVRLNWEKITNQEKSRSYWYTVAIRRMRRALKLQRRFIAVDPHEYLQTLPDLTDTINENDTTRAAITLVKGLPERQRAVVWLRVFADFSVEDTARILGVSAGTIKSTFPMPKESCSKSSTRPGGTRREGAKNGH